MELSEEQGRAAAAVERWLGSPDQQVFRLFGYAGTGKTSIARHLASFISGEVYFAAPTGKAAYVLRAKGCTNAMTVHKLIYVPRTKSAARLRELEEAFEKIKDSKEPLDMKKATELGKAIVEEQKNLGRPMFNLNMDSPLRKAKLVVVDEASMVDSEMGDDLASFGCKILALGDPAQLPPVFGAGAYTQDKPDFLLTEIHRQARDNPIIHLATKVRNGEMPALGSYGESSVRRDMDQGMALGADQMIVGKNVTRRNFNQRVRTLRGFEGLMPLSGDKLVCLRNSREHPLLNGSIWGMSEMIEDLNQDTMLIRVADGVDSVECLAHKSYFRGETPPWWTRADAEEFDYGYAITGHKAQGSQWPSVLVYDEGRAFGQDRWRWLYTSLTRASERVVVVRT